MTSKVYNFNHSKYKDWTVLYNEETKRIFFNFKTFCEYMKISKEYYNKFSLHPNRAVILYTNYDKEPCIYVDYKIIQKFLSSYYKVYRWSLLDWYVDILLFLDKDVDLYTTLNECIFIFASRILNYEDINKNNLKDFVLEKFTYSDDEVYVKEEYYEKERVCIPNVVDEEVMVKKHRLVKKKDVVSYTSYNLRKEYKDWFIEKRGELFFTPTGLINMDKWLETNGYVKNPIKKMKKFSVMDFDKKIMVDKLKKFSLKKQHS